MNSGRLSFLVYELRSSVRLGSGGKVWMLSGKGKCVWYEER